VPKYVAKGCLAGVGIAFVALLLLMWLLTNGPSLARGALPNANLPVFLISAVIGVIALGVTFLIVRTSEAARNWPRVRGRIVASGIRSRSSRQLRVVYYPWVRYDYTVEGRAFSAAVLKVGIEVGGSRRYAEKIVSRYPVGAIVDVSYDPKSPGNAALEHGSGLAWILPLIAGAALAIAAFASGLFGG
jgi:hypothetical protein